MDDLPHSSASRQAVSSLTQPSALDVLTQLALVHWRYGRPAHARALLRAAAALAPDDQRITLLISVIQSQEGEDIPESALAELAAWAPADIVTMLVARQKKKATQP